MNSRERCEDTFSVVSYEADFRRRLSLYALFNRFQDLAGHHAAYLQVGYDSLREMRLAWILSRIKVQIYSLPSWGDTVHLATWPKGVDRLFALRDFCLTNEKKETMVAATSAWLLVDIDKGRPRKIEMLPVDLRFPNAAHAIQDPLNKIQIPEGSLPVFEKPIWLSDIDTNGHVNNAQYAKWISDCFSQDQFNNRRITSVQINYLEETHLGDRVTLFKTPNDSSKNEYFLEGVNLIKGSKVFQAQIAWE
jgi:medium-chain acyl-[acyl-carrier-protein] hydrolase